MPAGAQYGEGTYICLLHGPYIYLYDEDPSPEDWEGDQLHFHSSALVTNTPLLPVSLTVLNKL